MLIKRAWDYLESVVIKYLNNAEKTGRKKRGWKLSKKKKYMYMIAILELY